MRYIGDYIEDAKLEAALDLIDRRARDGSAVGNWANVLIAESGSTIYGTSVGEDDLDLTLVGLESWGELVAGETKSVMLRTATGQEPSQPGDIDIQCHTLRKYLKLIEGGNPSILATLFAPRWQAWDRFPLEYLRDTYVRTRRAGQAYLGYSTQQLKRMRGEAGQKNVNRTDLIERFGYDTKYAYHALRLVKQGIEVAETGRIELPISEPVRTLLLQVRAGAFSQQRVESWIEDHTTHLETLVTDLPQAPSINGLITDLYKDFWLS